MYNIIQYLCFNMASRNAIIKRHMHTAFMQILYFISIFRLKQTIIDINI